MAFPNEHAARQADPEDFVKFRRNHPAGWPAGVDAVLGVRAGGAVEIQSVRFASSKFTAKAARTWLSENGFKTGGFEESTKGFEIRFKIAKIDEHQRLVFGWGYVTRDPSNKLVPPDRTLEDGTVVDHSGEVVDIDDLEKAMYGFVENSREGDVMHEGPAVASVVASWVFTPAMKSLLDLPDDFPEGAVIGLRVHSDEAWKRVRSGELSMLSLAGPCKREFI